MTPLRPLVTRGLVLSAVLVAGLTPVAHAQDHQTRGLFVAAGVHAAITELPSTVGSSPTGSLDISGTTGGAHAAIGTFVRPSVSLRIEVSIAGALKGAGTRPAFTYEVGAFTGPTVFILPPDTRLRRTSRDRDVMVMAAYHTAVTRRFRLAYLAGVTLQHTRTTAETVDYVPLSTGLSLGSPITYVERRTSSTTDHVGSGLALGMDLDLVVTARATVAPHVRVVADGGALSVRPGVQVRIAFR